MCRGTIYETYFNNPQVRCRSDSVELEISAVEYTCISVVELCSSCREGKRLVTLAEVDEKTEVSKSNDAMSLNKSSWTMRLLDGISLTDVSRPWTSSTVPVIKKKMMSDESLLNLTENTFVYSREGTRVPSLNTRGMTCTR
jgi:hypothetical protein